MSRICVHCITCSFFTRSRLFPLDPGAPPSCGDTVPRGNVAVNPSDDAEVLLTIAAIDSLTPCTCTCKCKLRWPSAVSRGGLPHALLHLLGQHRGHRKRGDALAPGPQAVEDQRQVPAPDPGTGAARELGGLGQQEDDERDVGRP